MGRRWGVLNRVVAASVATSMLILAGSGQVWSSERKPPILPVAELSVAQPSVFLGEATTFHAAERGRRKLPKERPARHMMVNIETPLRVTSRPGGGSTVGAMPVSSKYYHFPTVAWIQDRSPDGRFGKVTVPYSGTRRAGWIPLKGLRRSFTTVMVRVDLSRHLLTLTKGDRVIMRTSAATGAPWSPTPTGRFFVTDRVDPGNPNGYLGAYAFGISGIQTRIPPGWSGGNQLAIHGTNNPASIGRSASAGCVRVSARALMKLKPLLRLGTPVVIVP
jgi:lipoprotein-anchoring transpeptidase ErfK/SrfK